MDKLCSTCGLLPPTRCARTNNFKCRCPRVHVKVRNAFALHASMRKAVKFKDKRLPRGGQTNRQRQYVEEE